MKIYVHYEEGESERHMTLKLTLPRKWAEEPPSRILDLFVESYNKRKPDTQIDAAQLHLQVGDTALTSSDTIGAVITDRADVNVRPGATQEGGHKAAAAGKAEEADGRERCRNYGCNQLFSAAENGPEACAHHTKPPLFHDTKKGWSCCEKRVYDWEEFQKIAGCTRGPHSTTDPAQLFAPSPNASGDSAAPEAGKQAPPPVRSVEDFNAANPDAVTAASSAVKTMAASSRACTRRPDGTAKCLNKGCQKDFVVAENRPEACRHHTMNPVFHDTGKYWGCCPGVVKYDFDDFVAIPGCTVGPHDDGFDG